MYGNIAPWFDPALLNEHTPHALRPDAHKYYPEAAIVHVKSLVESCVCPLPTPAGEINTLEVTRAKLSTKESESD